MSMRFHMSRCTYSTVDSRPDPKLISNLRSWLKKKKFTGQCTKSSTCSVSTIPFFTPPMLCKKAWDTMLFIHPWTCQLSFLFLSEIEIKQKRCRGRERVWADKIDWDGLRTLLSLLLLSALTVALQWSSGRQVIMTTAFLAWISEWKAERRKKWRGESFLINK